MWRQISVSPADTISFRTVKRRVIVRVGCYGDYIQFKENGVMYRTLAKVAIDGDTCIP